MRDLYASYAALRGRAKCRRVLAFWQPPALTCRVIAWS